MSAFSMYFQFSCCSGWPYVKEVGVKATQWPKTWNLSLAFWGYVASISFVEVQDLDVCYSFDPSLTKLLGGINFQPLPTRLFNVVYWFSWANQHVCAAGCPSQQGAEWLMARWDTMLAALGSGLPWRLRHGHGPEEFLGLRQFLFVRMLSAKLMQQRNLFQREGHGSKAAVIPQKNGMASTCRIHSNHYSFKESPKNTVFQSKITEFKKNWVRQYRLGGFFQVLTVWCGSRRLSSDSFFGEHRSIVTSLWTHSSLKQAKPGFDLSQASASDLMSNPTHWTICWAICVGSDVKSDALNNLLSHLCRIGCQIRRIEPFCWAICVGSDVKSDALNNLLSHLCRIWCQIRRIEPFCWAICVGSDLKSDALNPFAEPSVSDLISNPTQKLVRCWAGILCRKWGRIGLKLGVPFGKACFEFSGCTLIAQLLRLFESEPTSLWTQFGLLPRNPFCVWFLCASLYFYSETHVNCIWVYSALSPVHVKIKNISKVSNYHTCRFPVIPHMLWTVHIAPPRWTLVALWVSVAFSLAIPFVFGCWISAGHCQLSPNTTSVKGGCCAALCWTSVHDCGDQLHKL